MLDINLLRILKYRNKFNQLAGLVPAAQVDGTTNAILHDFKKYFAKYPEHEKIDFVEFIPRFFMWHPSLKDEEKIKFKAQLTNIVKDVDATVEQNIISDLAEVELAGKFANMAAKFHEGELPNLLTETTRAVDQFKLRIGHKDIKFIDTPIEELLNKEYDNSGWKWRLSCLNHSMRGLRPGDFGIIAGRPDKGKTSFIASECTFFAPQLPSDQNVIWLNNEGPGDRIKPRLYQAALGLTIPEMREHVRDGGLVEMYRRAVGRLDRIRIFDVHGFDTGQVEAILEENNPGIVIYDMIDNIKGFGTEARTDRQLEEMYKWARELSVKRNCAGLATSQISADGDGLQFPTLGMLKDSKTGKQGACDFQLMIGASNDPNLQGLRFMGLPKNKLRRPGNPSDPRCDVMFDADRSRYVDREVSLSNDEATEINAKV